MAKLIPSFSRCSSRMTLGERRFAERLEEKLGDKVEHLAMRSRQFYEQGITWNEMAILYRERWMGETIWSGLKRFGLPLD